MADHLPLPPPEPVATRRASRPVPVRPVDRTIQGSRLKGMFAAALPGWDSRDVAGDVDYQADEDGDVDTRLVLRLTGDGQLETGPFAALRLVLLGESGGNRYFVLSSRESREFLRNLVDEYAEAGAEWTHRATWAALLDRIGGVELYGPADRAAPDVAVADFSRPRSVDVLLWPTDTLQQGRQRLADVKATIQEAARRNPSVHVTAEDPRPETTLIRAVVDQPLLDTLLDHALVERIRLPLRATVGTGDLRAVGPPVHPVAPVEGPVIGVVDDLVVTANPWLAPVVRAAEGFPHGHVFAAAPGPHGTQVAGIAAYGDLDPLLRAQQPELAFPVLNARVFDLDPQGNRSMTGPPHVVFRQAVEWLAAQGARVIVCSINFPFAADSALPDEFTVTLDHLAREHDLVIVVSAGNLDSTALDGAHWLDDYPAYLNLPRARVASPGDAALAVTVGSIARREVSGHPNAASRTAIARAGHASPYTRTGPSRGRGTKGTLKPEFAHYGGNYVWDHMTSRPSGDDPGVGAVVLIPPTGGRLAACASGTSFAAPWVAHEAARILARYPDATANLTRALLALSARHAGPTVLSGVDALDVAGYGTPDAGRVLDSGGPRAILTYEGTISTGSVAVHPLPVPHEFSEGSTQRRVRVSLAYDPPVRRRRRAYTAGNMTVEVVRGMSLEQVQATYGRQPSLAAKEADPNLERLDLPDKERRPRLDPGVQRVESNTLVAREHTAISWDPDHRDYFIVVTHNHNPSTARQRQEYSEQTYALAVELADQGRLDLDLHTLVRQQLRQRARVRPS